jgi:hypothetical protein
MKFKFTRSVRVFALSAVVIAALVALFTDGADKTVDEGVPTSLGPPRHSPAVSMPTISGRQEAVEIAGESTLPHRAAVEPASADPFVPLPSPAELQAVKPAAGRANEPRNASPAPQPAMSPASAPPPQAAVAPALPFTFVGQIEGNELPSAKPAVFLRFRDDVVVVRAGDVIANAYRVDSIASTRIDFTYLPLKQRQSISIAP